MTPPRHTDAVVIGAGISGLTTAHFLAQSGLDVHIIEKSARTGGTIETRHVDGFLVDCGPNSALETTPHLGELFSQVGVASNLVYASEHAKNRYIVKNGSLHALPMGPGAFLRTPLFSMSAKLRMLKEPFIARSDPREDESIADFVTRRLGREFLDYAINPFVSGVYAGRPERLSVRASFPKLHELEQRHGSLIKGSIRGLRERKRRQRSGEHAKNAARMFSFTGGMQTLVDALASEMSDRIHTQCTPVAVRRSDSGYVVDVRSADGEWSITSRALVLAIPTHAYAPIEFEMGFAAATQLSQIEYPPVTVVFLGYQNNPSAVPLDGFGFLTPEKEKRGILGTIWNSTLFAHRAPEGGVSLTTFVGGSRQPDNARLPRREMVDLVRAELKALLGLTATPDVFVVKCWEKAIPQYNVGHPRIIEAVEAFERDNPGIYLSGNFRGGVSISDCVRQAHTMSERVVLGLDPKGS